ncbi:MAG: hypothetical protein QGG42_03115 [Phycisphaerae bacterium]|jgi:hypothetical protein|nr:hypothetical protein [Phycisphaerae bacterium]
MHIETQFSVFLVNKPGVLAVVAGALAKAKVNVSALTLMDSVEHGVLRLVTDNAPAARKVLGKSHDEWAESDVLVMELDNNPGAFARVATVLAGAHINISYAYCTGGAVGGKTTAVFKVADIKKAKKLLAPAAKKKKKAKSASTARKPAARRGKKK